MGEGKLAEPPLLRPTRQGHGLHWGRDWNEPQSLTENWRGLAADWFGGAAGREEPKGASDWVVRNEVGDGVSALTRGRGSGQHCRGQPGGGQGRGKEPSCWGLPSVAGLLGLSGGCVAVLGRR